MESGIQVHQQVVEKGPALTWSTLNQRQVVGSEDGRAEVANQITDPAHLVAVDLHSVSTLSGQLDF